MSSKIRRLAAVVLVSAGALAAGGSAAAPAVTASVAGVTWGAPPSAQHVISDTWVEAHAAKDTWV